MKLTRLRDDETGIKRKQRKLACEGTFSAKISESLSFLMDGIEEYNFDIENFDSKLLISMTKDEVLTHLYHILLNYVDANISIKLSKVFVLYGVKLYEQKNPVNSFIVSFIRHLDKLLYDNEEFITIFEVINSFLDDPETLKERLRILITLKEKI